jgi:hypothetical protein
VLDALNAAATAVPRETLLTTTWPTIGATAAGRLVGWLSAARLGWGFFTLGKLLAVVTIPISLAVFCWQLMPLVCRRYALTDRRLIIQKGLSAAEGPSIALDQFDAIDVLLLPGQAWLHAGELIFRRAGAEVFRLSGVLRPEVFRQVCGKVRTAQLSTEQVIRQQAAAGNPG